MAEQNIIIPKPTHYNFVDIEGKSFGAWTVIGYVGKRPRGTGSRWLCRCTCGSTSCVDQAELQRGRSNGCRQCGAGRATPHRTTHGESRNPRTPEYGAYIDAKQRCQNKNNDGYSSKAPSRTANAPLILAKTKSTLVYIFSL